MKDYFIRYWYFNEDRNARVDGWDIVSAENGRGAIQLLKTDLQDFALMIERVNAID